MLRFEIDKKKMVADGGGSIASFCEKQNIEYRILTNIMASKRCRFGKGSKAKAVAEKLVLLGAARWVEVPDKSLSA